MTRFVPVGLLGIALMTVSGCTAGVGAGPTTRQTTSSATPSTEDGSPVRGASDLAARCGGQPGPGNTGATGKLPKRDISVVTDGTTVENATVPSLNITGNDVVIRNVKVEGEILVTGDRVEIEKVTTKGIAISSASDVSVTFTNVGKGSDDGIHVTSDRGRMAKNITLSNNYIHDPRVEPTGHYDGTQVRGVDGLTISCSTYDPGPYQPPYNAAVYLEDANGGDTGVVIRDNWLRGFGYNLMIAAKKVSITDNALGGDTHWGVCYLGEGTPSSAVTARGNFEESSGMDLTVCSSRSATP